MSLASVFKREAPARRGHRLLALASRIAFVASLAFAGAGFTTTARAANAAPQSSTKAPAKKGTAASKSSASSKKGKKGGKRHWEPIQKAPTTDRIEEIQTALSREGYYHGDPSKKWDANTQDAMRKFQEDHGMTGSGKLDATTLQKLGLGSDIAGVSAPRQTQQHPTTSPNPTPPPAPAPSTTSNADPTGN
jgi:peptidoglycan hydrolase-like protein with peptidoglycan-binding domain